jgi:hypothetical protein
MPASKITENDVLRVLKCHAPREPEHVEVTYANRDKTPDKNYGTVTLTWNQRSQINWAKVSKITVVFKDRSPKWNAQADGYVDTHRVKVFAKAAHKEHLKKTQTGHELNKKISKIK